MRLNLLLTDLPEARLLGAGDLRVSGVFCDSRQATPGGIFVAVPGFRTDGHDYLRQALDGGAVALVVQESERQKWEGIVQQTGVATVVLPDTRAALPRIAAALHGHPARRLNVVGITGTDGKTSLAHLIAHVLESGGQKAGLISTAECRMGAEPLGDSGRFTTPEAPEVQAMLAQMAGGGCRWAVIEATSHGLALHRVDECEYDIAVFTNLGRDHLDFHGSVEAYRDAKGRLFRLLDTSVDKGLEKTAVLNADDPAHAYFRGLTGARTVTYGLSPAAGVSAGELLEQGWATRFQLATAGSCVEAAVPRPGAFNVYNALAATAAALAAGIEVPTIVRALGSWPGAPGRLERVDEGQRFSVVVDFAHAADSLRRVLELLRRLTRGRLIAVFGCIGERDKDRRAAMGRLAAECADYTIVTDDNPYSEDRHAIIGEIAAGLRAAGKREGHDFALVADRREAIAQAVAMAVDEDAVLLAGKGHEREVHLADSVYECDDREVARRVLRELGHAR